MGIGNRDRFENHMDIASPETIGDAEKITDYGEVTDPYDDLFDKRLDEPSVHNQNEYDDFSHMIEGKDGEEKREDYFNKKKDNDINAHMVQDDFEDEYSSKEAGYNTEDVLSPESEELINEYDISTAIDNKVAAIPKQDLPKEIQDTFRGGNYRTVEALENMTLYRVYGEGAGKQGCFLTTQMPTDRMNTKIESALPMKVEGINSEEGFKETARWNNSREFFCKVNIPKGTILNIGKVAEQYTTDNHILKGGADQILVSPEFAADPSHYKNEQRLGYASNYNEFSQKAKEIESLK